MAQEFVTGGKGCYHAPAAIAIGREAFIEKFEGSILHVSPLKEERVKFLSGIYDECERLMNPPKYRGTVPGTTEVTETQETEKVRPSEKKSISKKETQKKE